jgi:hypothetical protein
VTKTATNVYDLIAAPPRVQDLPELEAAPTIRKIYEELREKDADPLDLEQDIILMRAVAIDYINRWSEFSDALISWYMDRRGKVPDKILDLSQAATIVEQISRVAARLHTMRESTAINVAAVRLLQDKMAVVLLKHIKDADTLRAIAADWESIELDPKAVRSDRTLTSGD